MPDSACAAMSKRTKYSNIFEIFAGVTKVSNGQVATGAFSALTVNILIYLLVLCYPTNPIDPCYHPVLTHTLFHNIRADKEKEA